MKVEGIAVVHRMTAERGETGLNEVALLMDLPADHPLKKERPFSSGHRLYLTVSQAEFKEFTIGQEFNVEITPVGK